VAGQTAVLLLLVYFAIIDLSSDKEQLYQSSSRHTFKRFLTDANPRIPKFTVLHQQETTMCSSFRCKVAVLALGYSSAGTVFAEPVCEPVDNGSRCRTMDNCFFAGLEPDSQTAICVAQMPPCHAGEFMSVAATDLSARGCTASLSNIPECYDNQYELTAPTRKSVRVCVESCNANGANFYGDIDSKKCKALTVCGDNEYEMTAPTPTANRVCSS